MKTIIAAIDFSPVSDLVVAEAAALARTLCGKVVLVTALVEPIFLKGYAPPPRSIAKITIHHERAVKNHLASIRKQLESDFISVETIVRRGAAVPVILEEAKKHEAAFIVIGSHGHTALFDLILGSTTQAVLKRARQPVVVIPPKMRKRRRMKFRVVACPVED